MAFLAGCLQIWPLVLQSLGEVGWHAEDIHRCFDKVGARMAIQNLSSMGVYVDALGHGCSEEPRSLLSLDSLPASESSRLAQFLKVEASLRHEQWIRQTRCPELLARRRSCAGPASGK